MGFISRRLNIYPVAMASWHLFHQADAKSFAMRALEHSAFIVKVLTVNRWILRLRAGACEETVSHFPEELSFVRTIECRNYWMVFR